MTVDGRGDTAASETGADALAVVIGHARPHGVPDVAGHEEVLVLAVGDGRWDWRHGRDHEVWRAGSRSVRDTGDICDLDDVGGPGEDGGGDGADGRLSPLAVAVDIDAAGVGLFVPYLSVLASAADAEPPGQEDCGEEGDATDDTASNGACGRARVIGRLVGEGIRDADGGSAGFARFGRESAYLFLLAGWTWRRLGRAVDDTSTEERTWAPPVDGCIHGC